jgi:hypothetical protein
MVVIDDEQIAGWQTLQRHMRDHRIGTPPINPYFAPQTDGVKVKKYRYYNSLWYDWTAERYFDVEQEKDERPGSGACAGPALPIDPCSVLW